MLKRVIAAAFVAAALVLTGVGVASATDDMTHNTPGMTHN